MAQQNLQIPEMQIVGHYPAGFLMLVYLPEIYSPLVILMPFWSLPYLHKNSKNSNRQSLHIAPGVMPKTTQWRCTQSSRAQCQQEGNIACWCKDTRPGHQLEASREQHKILCKCLKAKKVILHPSFLVWEAISTSFALNPLKELGLNKQTERLILNHMLTLCFIHINWQQLDALLINPVALKVLVWSRAFHPPGPH